VGPVLSQDYLNLRLVRLKAAEQWAKEGEGISFVFPRAGTGHFLRGGIKQALSPGDVLVLNGDSSAKICSLKGNEFAFMGFSLRLDHLFPLFAPTEISLLETITEGFKGCKLYPASSGLAGACHKLVEEISPQFNLDHRGQLLRLAAAILNEEFNMAHGHRVGFVRAEDHLVQVFEKLSAEEMLSLSVPELAERFGCSRRHLNRLFHQYFGFSVAALRMEMRLMKAISLLRNRDAKVINVAEQCGFNHLGLFNTCFRKRFGTSPGQWRKLATIEPEEVGVKPRGQNGSEPQCPLRITGLCPWTDKLAGRVQPVPSATPERSRGSARKNGKGEVEINVSIAAAQKASRSLEFEVRAQK